MRATPRQWMKRLCCIVGIGLPAMSVGCQAPITVRSAYGAGWDTAGLGSSFAWAPTAQEAARNVREVNPSLDTLIQDEVEKSLIGRGYKQAEGPDADFWVRYRVTRELLPDPEAAKPFEQYTEGSLFLDVINPNTTAVIWWASAQTRMEASTTPQQREARLKDAVQRMIGKLEKARM